MRRATASTGRSCCTRPSPTPTRTTRRWSRPSPGCCRDHPDALLVLTGGEGAAEAARPAADRRPRRRPSGCGDSVGSRRPTSPACSSWPRSWPCRRATRASGCRPLEAMAAGVAGRRRRRHLAARGGGRRRACWSAPDDVAAWAEAARRGPRRPGRAAPAGRGGPGAGRPRSPAGPTPAASPTSTAGRRRWLPACRMGRGATALVGWATLWARHPPPRRSPARPAPAAGSPPGSPAASCSRASSRSSSCSASAWSSTPATTATTTTRRRAAARRPHPPRLRRQRRAASSSPDLPEFERTVGIHTHGDGVIHIHPFSQLGVGANATLGRFFEDARDEGGLDVDAQRLRRSTYLGDDVQGGRDRVRGRRRPACCAWRTGRTSQDADADPEITTGDFDDLRLTDDGGGDHALLRRPRRRHPEAADAAANLAELGAADGGQSRRRAATPTTGATTTARPRTGGRRRRPRTTAAGDTTTTTAAARGTADAGGRPRRRLRHPPPSPHAAPPRSRCCRWSTGR